MENGDKVTDRITGFSGTITATITYLEGDTQHMVERISNDGQEVKSEWIREGRLTAAEPK